MSGYDYRKHDVRDVHQEAPRETSTGFRLRLGCASEGRVGRAVPFGSFGGVVIAAVLVMASNGPPLNLRSAAVFGGLMLVGATLLGLAARTLWNRAEIVCEEGQLYAFRTWAAGSTEAWAASEVDEFVAHVRRIGAMKRRRHYASEHMAFSVSARAGGQKLDLDLSLRPEQAERVARDLMDALSDLRVRRASRGGFRG
ncbi:MAG: hypothetical protein AB8I08_16440 [Sandaracinaceae bacterium]